MNNLEQLVTLSRQIGIDQPDADGLHVKTHALESLGAGCLLFTHHALGTDMRLDITL